MQTIDTGQAAEQREKGVPLIDVLPEEVHEQKHIAGTKNIPIDSDDFVNQVAAEAGGKDQPVIVYCANAQCDASPKAAQKLEQEGFTDVRDFEGGIAAWEEAGLSLAGLES